MNYLFENVYNEFDKARRNFEESNQTVDYHKMQYRQDRLYNHGVSFGDILLPVYRKDKLIAEVGWVGNLEHSYDGDVIMQGSGLLKVGTNFVLTKINGHELSTAEIVSKNKATELIIDSENYRLLEVFNL